MWIDAHVHLQDERLAGKLNEYADLAKRAGVTCLCSAGTSPSDWERLVSLTETFPIRILPSFGVHPWDAVGLLGDWQEKLENFLSRFPESPIGEIGLDGLRDVPEEIQLRFFRAQLALAVRLRRPVVLHGARSWGRLYEELRPCAGQLPGIMLHAFSASPDLAERFLALGAVFSFGGLLCNENATRCREAATRLPLDRIVIETDSPDCFPNGGIPFPGEGDNSKLNHSANLIKVATALSTLRDISLEEIARATRETTLRFFGMPV
ncbi:MAG: TatD family hydrolase [Kiritimatiellae bacterium]|nr:TatD family hydrolase [Kiritimatiellia bacterium]